ncbi:phage tail family protein [Staphylococcus epidermidis]|nr:phage tail family protein [Staphylococcus epidermidis]MCG2360205.1 phage tail family protein [Staphylococcus epidermidis]MCG2367203.1 phage tail family protein [Staphylococcus epidermidis]
MFNDSFETVLTDIPNLTFLDFDEEEIEVKANTVEISGTDGVLLGGTSYGPFKLVLRFFYRGQDTRDYNLLKQRLRSILFRREPYYIVHSDMPGKKYAVYCEANAITDIGTKFGAFEISFNVFRGYSESLLDTGQFSLSRADKWQFENGLLADENIKYTHSTTSFKIVNGSSDTIDPLMRHKLKIKMNINAPKGFKMTNKTTGDVFEYTKELKSNKQLVIDGVHPIINKQRVGVNTNYQWITLAPGENEIEITGEGISNVKAQFIFNFIYR